MSNLETVQPTQGELRDLISTVVQAIPNLNRAQTKQWLAKKRELQAQIRTIFKPANLEDSIRSSWEEFYQNEFGLTVDFSEVGVPPDPGGFDRVLFIAQGVTIEMVLEACRKYFKVWKYTDEDLDVFITENERTAASGHYAIRVRERVEADEELKNLSANDIKTMPSVPTLTLLERLIYELKYFKETGTHLDVVNWTLCAGSRYRAGSVPSVDWDGSGLRVAWCDPQFAYGRLRARQVVS